MKYSLSPRVIPRNLPSGFCSGSGYISHSISKRFFQCFSCIIDRVCQKTPTVKIWWEQIESQYRIQNLGQTIQNHPCNLGQTIRNRPCNLGQTIRNRPCNLGQTIRIRPCNSGRPIRNRPCNLGGARRNSCFAKCYARILVNLSDN